MRLFVTHMQDFTPLEWPIISYYRQAVVERLCHSIGVNEYILYVASQKCTRPNMRGKMLGFAKIKDRVVRHGAEGYVNPEKIDEGCWRNGNFKWPFGVLIGKAKLLASPQAAKPMIGPQFSKAPRGGFYILDDRDQVSKILKLESNPVDMSEAYQPPQ